MDQDHPNVAFFPPIGFAVTLGAVTLLGWLVPLPLPTGLQSATTWAGAVLAAIGAALGLSAILAFRRAGTNVEPHKPALAIVRGGVYRLTRNPMYLGLVSLTLGIGLWFANLWALPGAAALWLALDRGVVAREEVYLEAKFGDAYRALLSETRRWL